MTDRHDQKSATSAASKATNPWPATAVAMAVAAVLMLALGRTETAPRAFNSAFFWASATGAFISLALRAALLGGLIWIASWLLFLRRSGRWIGDNLGFAVMGAALLAGLGQWGVAVLIQSSPDSPARVSDRAAYLELANRKRLAADAQAFETQISDHKITGDSGEAPAMAALSEKLLEPNALAADPRLTEAKDRLQSAWEVMETYRALQSSRADETVAEAQGYKYGPRGPTPVLSDYKARMAIVAPVIKSYWEFNAAVEADTEQSISLLASRRATWSVEHGKIMVTPTFPRAQWEQLSAKLAADIRRLRGARMAIMNPRAGLGGNS
jgi:hypothetical protein